MKYLQLGDRYGYDPTWIEQGWPQAEWQWTERGIDRLMMYIEALDLVPSMRQRA